MTSEAEMGPLVHTYDVYPCEADLGFWRIVVTGGAGTPYANGTWLLSCRFPLTYPSHPPALRFETPVLHPNVNAHGRVCSALLSSEWSDTGGVCMPNVLRMVESLWAAPESANPVNTVIALDFYAADGTHEVKVSQHTAKHAKKSRAEWRAELLE